MAAQMLEVPTQHLEGKSLLLFIEQDAHQSFSAELTRRQQQDYFQEWELTIKSRNGRMIDVACAISVNHDRHGDPISFAGHFETLLSANT